MDARESLGLIPHPTLFNQHQHYNNGMKVGKSHLHRYVLQENKN